MTDIDRGGADGDRLPWLEAVDDEDEGEGIGAGKLIAAVIVALVAIGLIIGGIFWLREAREDRTGEGGMIAAPRGDYKVAPDGASANGMVIDGEGDASFAASEGADVNASIDVASRPEAPVKGAVTSVDASAVRIKALPPSTAAPAPAPAAKAPPIAAPAAKAPPAPAPAPAARPKVAAAPAVAAARPEPAAAPTAPAAGSSRIKIGAFSTEELAQAGWRKLTAQYSGLGGLSHSIEPGTSAGRPIYRLYASGPADRVTTVCRAMGSGCIKG